MVEYKLKVQGRRKEPAALETGLYKEQTSKPDKGEIKLFWKGTDVDFLELVTSLYASGVIKSNRLRMERKELIGAFESLFNLKIKNSGTKLSRARDRKKDSAPFLELLKQSFILDSGSSTKHKK